MISTDSTLAGIDLQSAYITEAILLEEDDSRLEQSVQKMHERMNNTRQSDNFFQVSFGGVEGID